MTVHLLQTAYWVALVLIVAVAAGAFWLLMNKWLDALTGDDELRPFDVHDGWSTERDHQAERTRLETAARFPIH